MVSLEVNITLTPEAKVGDYLLLHAGYAIQILDEKSANEIFEAWDDVYEAF
mgnify:FL=1